MSDKGVEGAAVNDSQADRTQIGLPNWASEKLERLVKETPWFEQQQVAFRVAVAVALRHGWQPVTDSPDTKWHVAGVDPDGKLKLLVETFAPACGARPYDYAQRIAAPGVHFLFEELIEQGKTLAEALGLEEREVLGATADN